MSYKVVYFTRTGTSKRIAEKIANKLSLEAIQITDNMNWKGVLGFIKGGYYASRNKPVDIKVAEKFNVTDDLIVVTPLWAGKVAPAIKTFLKTIACDKIHLVVTSNASNLKDRLEFKSVSDITKSKNNEDVSVDNIVKSFLLKN